MIILASNSPRRKELLKSFIPDFLVVPSYIKEKINHNKPIEEAIIEIAYSKGNNIYKTHKNDIIISADTVVILDNEIIGKPKDKQDAKLILSKLSNKKHFVITAYCIFSKKKVITNFVKSEVYFNKLSKKFIEEYVSTNSPLDKAGAYGIQDNTKFNFIKKIKGSYTNIIGFPVEEIKRDLNLIQENK